MFTGPTSFTGGNVGIGTASPASPLHVEGTAPTFSLSLGSAMVSVLDTTAPAGNTGGTMFLGGKAQTAAGPLNTVGFGGLKGGREIFGNDNYAGYLALYTSSGGALWNERMRVTSTGAVGIGTTSPSFTLHVNGSVAGTSAYNNLSDGRLKKDVAALEHGLDTVMKLRPVGFNWIAQDQAWKKQHQLGLIAQEVEPLVPEAVTTANDGMQTRSLAYSALIPVLIKAIQELKADNDNLRAAHASELAQIATLTARLDAIEAARVTKAAAASPSLLR